MRRLLSVGAVVGFRSEPVAQAAALLGISAGYGFLLVAWKPYVARVAKWSHAEDAKKFDVFNDLEKYGTVVAMAVQALALGFAANNSSDELKDGDMGSIVALVTGVTVLLFTLGLVAHCLKAACCGSAADRGQGAAAGSKRGGGEDDDDEEGEDERSRRGAHRPAESQTQRKPPRF